MSNRNLVPYWQKLSAEVREAIEREVRAERTAVRLRAIERCADAIAMVDAQLCYRVPDHFKPWQVETIVDKLTAARRILLEARDDMAKFE